jgi:repressor of nif and glnA expression
MHSRRLAELLGEAGYGLSERSVRLYLKDLDARGLTESHGRRGRTITEQGIAELRAAQTVERVGYLSARIDQLTYGMTFDLATRTGLVVVNTSLVNPRQLYACVDNVCQVFSGGFAMGSLLALLGPGETIGDMTIAKDKIGFCTVCSITLNGVLLKHGIPTASIFGGLLELREGRGTRFLEIIHYDGTSIDPLEVFIRSGMTDYHGAIATGNGRIGASFREMPEGSRDAVMNLANRLAAIGDESGEPLGSDRHGRLHGNRFGRSAGFGSPAQPRAHWFGCHRRFESDCHLGRDRPSRRLTSASGADGLQPLDSLR